MAASFSETFTIATPTGAALHVHHQPAAGPLRAVLHVNHGLAEHSGRYARFGQALSKAGISVYAHDHRGHGQTTAPDAQLRSFATGGNGFDALMVDIGALHASIQERDPGAPLFVFGHSMGGLIAMNYALRHPDQLAGAAVWNANFSGGIAGRAAQALLKWERFRLGSDMPSRILPTLTFGQWAKSVQNRRTDFDWLSDIDAQVDAYIADPLCGWDASVGMWQDVFSMIFAGGDVGGASSTAKALPFHLVGGGQDPATDNGKAVRAQAERMQKAGFVDVAVTIYPDTRHETLNSTTEQQATAELLLWLEALIEKAVNTT